MKIDKVVNNGGQNIFADYIINTALTYSETEKKIVDIIDKEASSEEEKIELVEKLNVLKDSTSGKEKRVTAKERIISFLTKHSGGIADSVLGAIIVELGKYVI